MRSIAAHIQTPSNRLAGSVQQRRYRRLRLAPPARPRYTVPMIAARRLDEPRAPRHPLARRKPASGVANPAPRHRLSRSAPQPTDAPRKNRPGYDPWRRVPHLPQNKTTKTCSGSARGLQGNSRLYGHQGAFKGTTVQPFTAAIIPSQFGVSRAQLQPYIGQISGGLSNGRTTTHFNSISDVIGGESPIRGMNVRDAFQQLFPGQFIVEITGGQDVGPNAAVVLMNYPADLPCPTGTSAQ